MTPWEAEDGAGPPLADRAPPSTAGSRKQASAPARWKSWLRNNPRQTFTFGLALAIAICLILVWCSQRASPLTQNFRGGALLLSICQRSFWSEFAVPLAFGLVTGLASGLLYAFFFDPVIQAQRRTEGHQAGAF